jgi:hypothetical protein
MKIFIESNNSVSYIEVFGRNPSSNFIRCEILNIYIKHKFYYSYNNIIKDCICRKNYYTY